MAKKDDSDYNLLEKMDSICSELNIDSTAAQNSKNSYITIKRNYTLEGEPLHWMACALYVACRTSMTPTVQSGTAVEGNCVSLTRLLRLCNISLIQFFNKIKNWMEMSAMSTDFKTRIDRLERKFAVSTVLYRKFQPIFLEIFTGLTNDPIKPNARMSKKQKLTPCTANALLEFTWCLYICVKGEFHKSADDLVDMYHVLLACLDFVFGNAFMSRRTDVLNLNFKGLPSNYVSDDFEMPSKPPCIISTLCEIKDGLPIEAATMKEYSWKPVVKSFFEKGILKGDKENLLGVLEIGNFDVNLKSVNNIYETYVLSVGEFDERIFLGEHANEQIGSTPTKVSGDEISKVIATFGTSGRSTCPDTPLTGRRYLTGRAPLTPVSAATHSLARLRAYLAPGRVQLNAAFVRLLTENGVSEQMIQEKLVQTSHQWSSQLLAHLRETNSSNENVAYRCNMVTCLYYKVFEHILREEHRKKPHVSLEMLVTQETYQRALYACCSEIVVFSYGAHSMRFPRVLQVFSISALHFYKIIELVVHAIVDKMSRDVIKHLNAVEEEVLESLVWLSDSPLWQRLEDGSVPACSDVYAGDHHGFLSPVSAPFDRVIPNNADQAKKQLFKDNVKPGQSLLVSPTTTSNDVEMQSSSNETTPTRAAKNSLMLFFRKFYSLAVVRMNDLCARLRLCDEELRRKIWTCLEHCVVQHTQLLRDRHLDQILMCSVYVICKVSHSPTNQVERTFAEIMRCYRQRPLADNHVYRSVLIDTENGTPERGDLIKFYNKVYVQKMQTFALRFSGKNKDGTPLSPLPWGRSNGSGAAAGQRVSERHQLYVKPLSTPPHHHHRLVYRFSRSPAKDLHAINSMLSTEVGGAVAGRCKRGGDADDDVVKRSRIVAPGVARKLHGLMTDRQCV